MAINAESRILNIRRSVNKYLHNQLVLVPPSPLCYINYGDLTAPVPSSYDVWISIHFLPTSGRVYSEGRFQINVQSKVIKDKLGNKAAELADIVIGALNVNTIVLYDFADPLNLVDLTPYLLIPRLWETGDLPTLSKSQVRGITLDYKLFLSRGSLLN